MTLRSSEPTARKAHRCDWCTGTIQPGEQYRRSTNVGDDGLYEWIACAACDAIAAEVWDWAGQPDEGMATDSFDEWASDHAGLTEHAEAARAYLARREAGHG